MNNQNPPRQPRTRHAYLPGLAAYDANHSLSAFKEISYRGKHGNHIAGSLFVDSVDAQAQVRNRLGARQVVVQQNLAAVAPVSQQLRQFPKDGYGRYSPQVAAQLGELHNMRKSLMRENADLTHAQGNIQVLNQLVPQQQPVVAGKKSDILFVKGHGSAENSDQISTVSYPVDTSGNVPAATGLFAQDSRVRVQRGFKAYHSFGEIAGAVTTIAGSVQTPGLDVRITSCGGAGTVSRQPLANPMVPNTTFAGKVSEELDARQVNRAITVSGYQGDSNRTFPSDRAPGDGYLTTVKQGDSTPSQFESAKGRFRARVGQLAIERVRVKNSIKPSQVRERAALLDYMTAGSPQPVAAPMPVLGATFPGMPPALRAKVRGVTKLTQTSNQNQQFVALGPRSKARVQFQRA